MDNSGKEPNGPYTGRAIPVGEDSEREVHETNSIRGSVERVRNSAPKLEADRVN